jgi:hypothetical protein
MRPLLLRLFRRLRNIALQTNFAFAKKEYGLVLPHFRFARRHILARAKSNARRIRHVHP